MALTKVTNLFHASTVDPEGNPKRIAGFSESFYSQLAIDSLTLKANWSALAEKRAALMPANVSIIGGRFQTVDPIGPNVSYDVAYPPPSTAASDLPGVALQFTVRSTNSPNQRSVILRGIPDGRVQNGEYAPTSGYNAALMAYFGELKANWGFRTINRTLLPVKIISISDVGLVTTATPHGLQATDNAMIMSAIRPNGRKVTDPVIVTGPVTATTFNIFVPRLGRDEPNPALFGTLRGRVRKIAIEFHNFAIVNDEIIHPTAIHRKAGAPFRKFVGRRTAKR